MTCRGFIQFLLKVINFLFILAGLAMIGYGIYMVITYENSSETTTSSPPPPPPSPPPPSTSPPPPPPPPPSPPPPSSEYYHSKLALKREVQQVDDDIAFVHLRRSLLYKDSTFELSMLSSFWSSIQAFALLLAVILRAIGASSRKDYDSDDEYLLPTTSRGNRQPLLNRQAAAGTTVNPNGSESRPARADAWSTRMREKYGLDTTEFSYNPESKRITQQTTPTEEKKGCCTIM
ncbi:hypothetical protein KP509_27G065800 [Ceratopteris richardii]|uniref:Uncharacterized protein n=1 Tax=Ceratopteris richardii TaxID=49495 RepID=A0A8T2RJP1_CERRI|nr:hypothetical protein KP509_27G065800 [Ceratopteris richardii]